MKIGIIGYGSMGKMILEKLFESGTISAGDLYVANRTYEKIADLASEYQVCRTNAELAAMSDMVFICVRPVDIKAILVEIAPQLRENTLIISLNGSVTFENMSKVVRHKTAKVIPSVTAEINQSQTLVCYNELVPEKDKEILKNLLACMGKVIELPEAEIGMGSELVSCMPGFIAAIFNEICVAAKNHTSITEEEIVQMVLSTMVGTGNLMLTNGYSFEDVINRVATRGGITEEGTKVIHEKFPKVAEEMFQKTLEKRELTARKSREIFEE